MLYISRKNTSAQALCRLFITVLKPSLQRNKGRHERNPNRSIAQSEDLIRFDGTPQQHTGTKRIQFFLVRGIVTPYPWPQSLVRPQRASASFFGFLVDLSSIGLGRMEKL